MDALMKAFREKRRPNGAMGSKRLAELSGRRIAHFPGPRDALFVRQ
jgi:hypothetical protein